MGSISLKYCDFRYDELTSYIYSSINVTCDKSECDDLTIVDVFFKHFSAFCCYSSIVTSHLQTDEGIISRPGQSQCCSSNTFVIHSLID